MPRVSVADRATVLDAILPWWVESAEAFGDGDTAALLPAEDALMSGAVAKRRSEFATVRTCARTALARLGLPPAPILPGAGGAPRWPAGAVGSMTHCDGYRAAAVASSRHAVTVGIDAEPHEPLPAGVLDAIVIPGERPWLARLAADRPDVCWDRLLFTVKEAVYKAWFPLTHRWLDFDQAAVTVGVDGATAGTFVARLRAEPPVDRTRRLTELAGRWVVRRGVVVSAVAVATAAPRGRRLVRPPDGCGRHGLGQCLARPPPGSRRRSG